jgi:putative flippase GtrA
VKEHILDIYRNKKLTAKFGIIGGTGFVCNYIVLKIGINAGINHIIAEVIAVIVALQITFILHDKWTYRIDPTIHKYHYSFSKRYRAYIASNSFGSLLTVIFFALFALFLNHFIALACAAVAGLMWNFLMNKAVIWKHKPHPPETNRDS